VQETDSLVTRTAAPMAVEYGLNNRFRSVASSHESPSRRRILSADSVRLNHDPLPNMWNVTACPAVLPVPVSLDHSLDASVPTGCLLLHAICSPRRAPSPKLRSPLPVFLVIRFSCFSEK
jgi:hypothetical protein